MLRDSSPLNWRGPRPAPIAGSATEHRRSPATNWPEWSSLSAEARPADGVTVDFVVKADRAQLTEMVQRVRDGRLRTNIDNVIDSRRSRPRLQLDQATLGRMVIRVRP